MPGHISDKYYLSDFIENFRKNLKSKVEELEITEQTNTSQIAERLIKQYTIHPLELGEPSPSKPKEMHLDRTNHWGETYKQKVFEVKVEIPFEGNSDLFHCKPSTSTIIYFSNKFQINPLSVSFWVILDELDADKYQAEVNKFKVDLSANIGQINSEVSRYNNQLEATINSLLENRGSVVSQKFDFMEKIGLKVNPKSDDYMIPSPVVKKRIPVPVSETQSNVERKIVPILQDKVYEDIKQVIYNVGKAVERKPSLYLKKHEEDLRDIFLLFLETRYDSTTGVGEAFNKIGKTDILLKYAKDGSNLFVAECKFWKGQKKMLEAIDQLLGYLTHRDSKTAIMVFVDQKDFSAVIDTVRDEVVKHPNFVKYLKDTYSSSISYQFSLPDDSKSMIQIEFMFFHFPPIS
ncbi:hypothetical protein [Mucilaginibacter sp. SP1R1]|uniref:hypothetical protein n=1 Tax=Mucilaginibacter sp. SP1R1 TaxID=2723091 RepID=UPI001617DE54|nr:hypothetical protein [Mucilaginibacter sp. SP1R1]MBB6147463.1 hypothetical protein [Mucilaginibacter sp. SP1R1]